MAFENDIFIEYKGAGFIKFIVCLEEDGFCLEQESDLEQTEIGTFDAEVTKCKNLCSLSTDDVYFCDEMCDESPIEALEDLNSTEFNSDDIFEELENNVGSINNENCYASCMSAYIFRYYCNYLCYHLRFQTTSTTEPPTTLGNSKRWYPIRRG